VKNYVAVCPQCKRVLGAVAPTCPTLSKDVARWLKAGLSVERMTDEELIAAQWRHTEACDWRKKS